MTTFNVYRRQTVDDTPVAIATGLTSKDYSDATAVNGESYLYSIGAIKEGVEKIGSEIKIKAGGDLYWDDVITLLNFESNDLTDATEKRTWSASDISIVTTNAVTLWGNYCLDLTGTSLGHYIYP